jgi:hypothetical protein
MFLISGRRVARPVADPKQFRRFLRRLHRQDWAVYAKPGRLSQGVNTFKLRTIPIAFDVTSESACESVGGRALREEAGMSRRREFIQRGLAASALIACPLTVHLALAESISGVPYRPFKVVFDQTFAEGAAFGAEAVSRGARAHAVGSNAGVVWMNEIEPRWKRGPAVIAGLTGRASLFCLELLARDYRVEISLAILQKSISANPSEANIPLSTLQILQTCIDPSLFRCPFAKGIPIPRLLSVATAMVWPSLLRRITMLVAQLELTERSRPIKMTCLGINVRNSDDSTAKRSKHYLSRT